MADHCFSRGQSAEEEALRHTNDVLAAERALVVLLLRLLLSAILAQDMAAGSQHHHGLLLLTNLASSRVALQALLWRLCRSIPGDILPGYSDKKHINIHYTPSSILWLEKPRPLTRCSNSRWRRPLLHCCSSKQQYPVVNLQL